MSEMFVFFQKASLQIHFALTLCVVVCW